MIPGIIIVLLLLWAVFATKEGNLPALSNPIIEVIVIGISSVGIIMLLSIEWTMPLFSIGDLLRDIITVFNLL